MAFLRDLAKKYGRAIASFGCISVGFLNLPIDFDFDDKMSVLPFLSIVFQNFQNVVVGRGIDIDVCAFFEFRLILCCCRYTSGISKDYPNGFEDYDCLPSDCPPDVYGPYLNASLAEIGVAPIHIDDLPHFFDQVVVNHERHPFPLSSEWHTLYDMLLRFKSLLTQRATHNEEHQKSNKRMRTV